MLCNFPLRCLYSAAPMGTTAKDEMDKFWLKNAKLSRPVSPHLTIYKYVLLATCLCPHMSHDLMVNVLLVYCVSDGLSP